MVVSLSSLYTWACPGQYHKILSKLIFIRFVVNLEKCRIFRGSVQIITILRKGHLNLLQYITFVGQGGGVSGSPALTFFSYIVYLDSYLSFSLSFMLNSRGVLMNMARCLQSAVGRTSNWANFKKPLAGGVDSWCMSWKFVWRNIWTAL